MSSPTAEQAFGPSGAGGDMQRRLYHLDRWRRRSVLIHVLRRALPALIAVMLAALLGLAGFNALALRQDDAGQAPNMSIRMVNPKFFGRDGTGAPFSLSAVGAIRDDNDFQRIYLEQPAVVLGDKPAQQTRVMANKGVYREDTRVLVLDGDVRLRDPRGNEFLSQHAVVDTLTKDVDGDARIDGHGPLGRLSSSSYAVRDGGAHVFFKGQVKAHIDPHAVSAQPATSAAGETAAGVKSVP